MFYSTYVKLCTQKGETVSAAGEHIGVSRAAVNGWKKGSIPRDTVLKQIADYFGVTVSYLLSGDESSLAESQGLSADFVVNRRVQQKIPADPKTSEEVDEYIRSLDDPAELMRIMELALKRQRELGGK